MKQEKYFAYMETFYDSVTVNQEELAKYDNIPAVQSFPLFTTDYHRNQVYERIFSSKK
jgi:hypothetical protein